MADSWPWSLVDKRQPQVFRTFKSFSTGVKSRSSAFPCGDLMTCHRTTTPSRSVRTNRSPDGVTPLTFTVTL